MAGKVINLDILRRGAPRRGGYLVLNQRTIATFYATLHPHSKELYLFRLLDDEKRRPISLMDGNLPIIKKEDETAKEEQDAFIEENSQKLLDAVRLFTAKVAPLAKKSDKLILATADDGHIVMAAVACDRGVIIGGWYNSVADIDIGKLMLAFGFYGLAAINATGRDADKKLKEHAYDTIPRDSSFPKFSVSAAQNVLLGETAEKIK